jgi:hypothetical protein
MACPGQAARDLASLLPGGPVLELCCGVGGLTVELARNHRVLAIDRSLARLEACRENLSVQGLEAKAGLMACDLNRPALSPLRTPFRFAVCVLDPDWSPRGRPVQHWTANLGDMSPPVLDAARWALAFSPLLAIRLPKSADCDGLDELGPVSWFQPPSLADSRFGFMLVGNWAGL